MNRIYLKRLQDATLTDDYMFGQVMSREAIAAAFLSCFAAKTNSENQPYFPAK